MRHIRKMDRRSKFVSKVEAGLLLLLLLACASCGQESGSRGLRADDIPVAHTPPGGYYGEAFPAPILASCTEPLISGAPDLRGT